MKPIMTLNMWKKAKSYFVSVMTMWILGLGTSGEAAVIAKRCAHEGVLAHTTSLPALKT